MVMCVRFSVMFFAGRWSRSETVMCASFSVIIFAVCGDGGKCCCVLHLAL